jgi:hypothetical protein
MVAPDAVMQEDACGRCIPMTDGLQKALADFRAAAEPFLHLVEKAQHLGLSDFLAQLNYCLPPLYSAALLLPEVEPESEHYHDFRTHEDWKRLYATLQEQFGSLDPYWDIYDPTDKNEEKVQGSLADDIADIYLDIKGCLLLSEKKVAVADVVWQLQFNFIIHWGAHLVSALRAIHWHRSKAAIEKE